MKICIDGNIGCGKSMVNEILKKRGRNTVNEPVETWTLLPLFYENPKLYSFALQNQIITSYCAIAQYPNKTFIVERGALCAYCVFSKMLCNKNLMTPFELTALSMIYENLPLDHPDLIIYLDLPANKCLERIQKRNRTCESSVDLQYLESVENFYQQFLIDAETDKIKVVKINVEQYESDPESLANEIEKIIDLYDIIH